MPTKANTIQIRRLKDGSFSLKKDKNLLHMIGVASSIQKVIFELSKIDGKFLTHTNVFTELLNKIVESEKSIISKDETLLLHEWIDCLCLFHLEIEGINYDEKALKKFLGISQEFLRKTKTK